jgi:NAD(P)H-hydrate epimerase
MARLLGTSPSAVQANRVGVARDLARAAQAVVVLKGARTVIADPDGTAVLSPIAEPALATGGTGDVLTGLLGALLVQGLDPLAAACAGVWLHGRAGGESAATYGTAGVVAGDLPDAVARIMARSAGLTDRPE